MMWVVEEEWLMVSFFHGIGLFSIAVAATTVLRGKSDGERHKRRIAHWREGGAIHAVWEVGLVPQFMILLLLVLLLLLLVKLRLLVVGMGLDLLLRLLVEGVVWREYLAALPATVAKVHGHSSRRCGCVVDWGGEGKGREI